MDIKVQFQVEIDYTKQQQLTSFERIMPAPPRVGELISFEATGDTYEITRVSWIIPDHPIEPLSIIADIR